jgi:hypothetical protein
VGGLLEIEDVSATVERISRFVEAADTDEELGNAFTARGRVSRIQFWRQQT